MMYLLIQINIKILRNYEQKRNTTVVHQAKNELGAHTGGPNEKIYIACLDDAKKAILEFKKNFRKISTKK